jgi:hypothetical protein
MRPEEVRRQPNLFRLFCRFCLFCKAVGFLSFLASQYLASNF